mgnify:CR=1 FL=1
MDKRNHKERYDAGLKTRREVLGPQYVDKAMAGVDEKDERTADSGDAPADYTKFLESDSLKGVRLGYSPQDIGSNGLFEKALAVLEKEGATLVETDTLSNTSLVGITEIGLIPNHRYSAIGRVMPTMSRKNGYVAFIPGSWAPT